MLRYSIGYDSEPGKQGAQIGLAFHPSLELGPCGTAPASAARDPRARQLYTSAPYLAPEFDKTHSYSAPVTARAVLLADPWSKT